ncbi:hypothetical protein V2I01_27560 [Micromonospora sp. BRA006-A]|nr:hypothetical protein [Micromonospora sp. BRA006-A]
MLMLVGGRFVTSGKVYEFMASGLPVLSAHDVDHDASNVLAGHPLWTGAVGLDPHRLAGSFVEAGRLALKATDADRAAARDLARRFARPAVLAPAVRRLTELVRPTGAGAATRPRPPRREMPDSDHSAHRGRRRTEAAGRADRGAGTSPQPRRPRHGGVLLRQRGTPRRPGAGRGAVVRRTRREARRPAAAGARPGAGQPQDLAARAAPAWLRQRFRSADLLVALDPRSVYTVWEMAQRNTRAGAHFGLVPAQRALDAPRTEPVGKRLERQVAAAAGIGTRGAKRAAVETVRTTVQKATGQRIMSNPAGAWFWSRAVAAPRVPDRLRSSSRYGCTTAPSRRAARRSPPGPPRPRSAGSTAPPPGRTCSKAAQGELALGHVPSGLHDAIRAQLTLADARLAKDPKKAAAAVSRAWSLASNRVLHFDRLSSPMSDDPGAFLAPFRRARRRGSCPSRGAGSPRPPRHPPTGRCGCWSPR